MALETEQKERKSLAGDKGDGCAEQGHHNAGRHQQENDADCLPKRCHRCQVAVSDGGECNQRVPERILKRADCRAAVMVL